MVTALPNQNTTIETVGNRLNSSKMTPPWREAAGREGVRGSRRKQPWFAMVAAVYRGRAQHDHHDSVPWQHVYARRPRLSEHLLRAAALASSACHAQFVPPLPIVTFSE